MCGQVARFRPLLRFSYPFKPPPLPQPRKNPPGKKPHFPLPRSEDHCNLPTAEVAVTPRPFVTGLLHCNVRTSREVHRMLSQAVELYGVYAMLGHRAWARQGTEVPAQGLKPYQT
ncbi:hypothetical protein FA13DRAFT_1738222 [Coprinellus micaceus]|uniref:Uncharacterized protein n=1 Tax=Coprinellus micaceus TaxID=71717 RepID=A0A4Y7SUF5_COPMI|nr:hypothetical protein FA13DRAFT_1738222 [Coprinellus micaceus]